jgi:hypothetical protein
MLCSINLIIFSNKFFNRYNTVLWDILLKIPGINSKNIKDIMDKVNNLCDLCQKTEEELNAIVENAKNAKLIYEFLNKAKKDLGVFEKEFDFQDVDDFNVNNSEKKANNQEQTSSNSKATSSKTNKKPLVKIGSNVGKSKKKKTN